MYMLYSSNFALIYLTTKYMAPLCCALNSVSVESTFGAAIWRITMNKSYDTIRDAILTCARKPT